MEKSKEINLELKRSRGCGRRAIAYKRIAGELSIKKKTVAIICKYSRKCMLLMGNGGLGSLQR
jgi:hypothetical protein